MTTNVPAVYAQGGALATTGGNPFLDAAEDMGAASSALWLSMDGNTGIFAFGKDKEELPKGTRLAVNPNEFKAGWICWVDGKPVEEIMVRVVDGRPPAQSTLTDHGPYDDPKDGWRSQSSIQLRDIETGDEYVYKASSKGGTIAVANLIKAYGTQFQKHPGSLAVIELRTVAFDAKDPKTGKKLGRKYAPDFKIASWMDEADLVAKFEAQAAESEDEAPEPDLPVNTGGRRSRNFG